MKKILSLLMCTVLSLGLFSACAKKTPEKGENPIVTITLENGSVITAELYPDIAPNTVNNFISLANDKFYDGLIFHRVVPKFVIQAGCPLGTGTGGPGYSINGEITKNGFENKLKHTTGILSMARNPYSYDSAGSQFFIVTADRPDLDGKYAAFGKVTNGIDVVHEIENVEIGDNDKPVKDIVIKSIRVDTKGVKYPKPETF